MRIMAIDYGDAHTGAAVSDLTGLLAGHTQVIHSRKPEEVLSGLGQIIGEYGVTELVLGYPKNMDGTLGPRAEKAELFAQELEAAFGLPVHLWEEDRGRGGGGADPGGLSHLPARPELSVLSF